MSTLANAALVVLLWSVAGAAAADTLLDLVNKVVQQPTLLVQEWEEDRAISFMMVVVVFVIGFFIAVIHTLPATASKIAALVLGSAVTLLTGVSNAYFDFDHRQYRAMASQGRQLLTEIEVKKIQLADFPVEQKAARDAIFEDIRRHANAIIALPSTFKERSMGAVATPVATPAADRVSGWLMAPAFAQSRAPDWVNRLPVDNDNLYFLGQAEGRDYFATLTASKQNAYEQARSYLSSRLQAPRGGVDSGSAARYLLDSARIANTYSSYNRQQASVRVYTLLTLSKKVAESDLSVYGAKNSQQVSPVQQQSLRGAVRTQSEYLRK